MGTRLALVNCKGPTEGPWTRAKGNESGIEIFMLGKGACVRFEYKSEGLIEFLDYYKSGAYSLPSVEFDEYRVSKMNESESATIVRVQLNGKS
jgi:hypothetical protein